MSIARADALGLRGARGTRPGAPSERSFFEPVRAVLALEMLVMGVEVVYHLGSKPLFVDEGFTDAMARLHWPTFWHIVVTREANQSLYYLMLRGLVRLGATEAWLRLVPAVAAVLSVPVVYAVGRRLFNERVGLWAGFLLCLNGFFVWHGQYSRAYTLVVLLVSASSLLFACALDKPTTGRWAAWGAISGLACYAHFFAAFAVGAQLLALALPGRRELPRRQVAVGLGVAAALVAPLAVFVAVAPGDQIGWITRPRLHDLAHVLDSIAGHGGPALLAAMAVPFVLALVVLWERWHGPDRDRATWPVLFALGWLVVPVVAAFALSLAKPIVQDQYLIVSLPALMVVAGLGLDRLVGTGRTMWLVTALLALVTLGGRSVVQVYGHGNDENWRGATALVLSRSRPDDGLVFAVSDERTPFEYYVSRRGYPANTPAPLYPHDAYGRLVPVSEPSPQWSLTQIDALFAGREDVWVLQRAAKGDAGPPRFRLPSVRYVLVERHRFTDVDVALYQRRIA